MSREKTRFCIKDLCVLCPGILTLGGMIFLFVAMAQNQCPKHGRHSFTSTYNSSEIDCQASADRTSLSGNFFKDITTTGLYRCTISSPTQSTLDVCIKALNKLMEVPVFFTVFFALLLVFLISICTVRGFKRYGKLPSTSSESPVAACFSNKSLIWKEKFGEPDIVGAEFMVANDEEKPLMTGRRPVLQGSVNGDVH